MHASRRLRELGAACHACQGVAELAQRLVGGHHDLVHIACLEVQHLHMSLLVTKTRAYSCRSAVGMIARQSAVLLIGGSYLLLGLCAGLQHQGAHALRAQPLADLVRPVLRMEPSHADRESFHTSLLLQGACRDAEPQAWGARHACSRRLHLRKGAGRDHDDALGRRLAGRPLPQQRPDQRDHLQRLPAPRNRNICMQVPRGCWS